ncbi:MAG: hypothetical protein OXD54_06730 [Candidatus Poribacteria bacterium]|nr:hypothetical protein [Candidatus Poribacteria bacterium]
MSSGTILYQDTGFQGWTLTEINIVQPKKKPKGRDLTIDKKENNWDISSIRTQAEHAIAGVKRYRIVQNKLRN